MTPQALLDQLQILGVCLTAQGERLQVDASPGVLTDELRQAIRQHKQELLVLLAQEPMVPEGCMLTINPQTGQPFVTRLYRCQSCGGTDWGPHPHGYWHCRACAGEEGGHR